MRVRLGLIAIFVAACACGTVLTACASGAPGGESDLLDFDASGLFGGVGGGGAGGMDGAGTGGTSGGGTSGGGTSGGGTGGGGTSGGGTSGGGTSGGGDDGGISDGGGGSGGGDGGGAVASCTDGSKNGTETDTDCGGADCDPCAEGDTCLIASDCEEGADCGNGFVCVAASCADDTKNGSETDTDCGGADCPGCANGDSCEADTDCASGDCDDSNVCACVPTLTSCGDTECGTKSDGCGNTVTCPVSCSGDQTCQNNACVDPAPTCDPGSCGGCSFLQTACCTASNTCSCRAIWNTSCN